MGETTATVAETRANFSKIAATVNVTGRPVTVFKELEALGARGSRGEGLQGPHPQHRLRMDTESRRTVLPAEWDDPVDVGLYDDLA